MLVLHLTRGEINVGQRVKFIDYDVDIVRPDAMAETHNGFTLVSAANGVELTRRHLEVTGVEMLRHDVDAGRVAHEDYAVGQLLGKQVEMKHRPVLVDDKLRRSDYFLFHGVCMGLWLLINI